jgi:hypothetical protein
MQIDYSARHPYLLYALTVSGVAYLLKLRNISTYASSSAFPSDELLEFNIHTYSNHGAITTVAATAGFFAVGFNDGSVCCFQLGILDQSAPGISKTSLPPMSLYLQLLTCSFLFFFFVKKKIGYTFFFLTAFHAGLLGLLDD